MLLWSLRGKINGHSFPRLTYSLRAQLHVSAALGIKNPIQIHLPLFVSGRTCNEENDYLLDGSILAHATRCGAS